LPSELVEVVVLTNKVTLKGWMATNSADKPHRRISETLNNETRTFIVLSDVSVQPLSGKPLPSSYLGQNKIPFLYVNRHSIELLMPVLATAGHDPENTP
jgi:hypothetical protein